MGENDGVPELPEVQALVDFLRERTDGLAVAGVELGVDRGAEDLRPAADQALAGLTVTASPRHGKFIDLDVDGMHLVFHLARAGWLRWSRRAVPDAVLRPGKSPIALRVPALRRQPASTSPRPAPRSGSRRTSSATPARCPASRRSAPTRWPTASTCPSFAAMLGGRRTQVKGLLRDQGFLAGVGNAYSDEVLHAARLSPFALAVEPGRGAGGRGSTAALREILPARGRGGLRQAGQGAQGRQAGRHAGARSHRVALSRCAATPCARCRSPTPRCSTAPPARPGASRLPTGGCRGC